MIVGLYIYSKKEYSSDNFNEFLSQVINYHHLERLAEGNHRKLSIIKSINS